MKFSAILGTATIAGAALAGPPPAYDIAWFTIDCGGGASYLDDWEVSGTIAQHDVSRAMSGGGFGIVGGFWQVPLRPQCHADYNLDGQVDFFDYLDFVVDYDSEAAAADFNGDGQIDFFDYLDFAEAYNTGCP